jgi:hypothetical protein
MLGFGALRAMNDAVKANRELLRGNKKSFFERDVHYTLRTDKEGFKDKKASQETIALIRASAQRDAKREKIKAFVVFILSVLVLVILIFTLFPWGAPSLK